MNYFTQLFEQARNLVLSLTPASRMIAAIMLLAIVVGAGFLVRDVQQTNMELLFGGHVYKESELQLAETAMSNAGLKKYERIGMRIQVPKSERDLYIKALADGGATPQQFGGATGKALSGGNILESMYMSKTRILDARQKDVANVLERLPFVDKVYVTYDEKREGFSNQSQSTASVFVLPRNARPLEEQQKRSIINQVRATFAGLRHENISVMDMSSGLSMIGKNDPISVEQERYFQQKLLAEQQLKDKALNLMVDYGDVRIEANVELDTTLREETESVKYGEKPVTLQTTTSKKDSESSRPVTGGRPGAEPNAIANRSQSLATQNEQSSKSKEQLETENKIVGQETTLSEKVGLAVKSASLSVSIPLSYYSVAFRREWQELNPGKNASEAPTMGAPEMKSIKEGIHLRIKTQLANLLPATAAGVDLLPRIIVDDYLDVPPETIPGPSIAATATGWLASNWQSLVMFIMVGVALMSLRSFVASGSGAKGDEEFERGFNLPLDDTVDSDLADVGLSDVAIGGVSGSGGSTSQADAGDNAKEARAKFSTTGTDLREELASLVKENPDVAASLLRTWIGEAA
ncbi:MAG: flagellar M-ring protein FliF C-terminal domain-containing protein [Pirellulaceae bacterium]|nr:flagellar M-ring protein FliF C-terminal domain-containing protein [Pirellulaceae bacterium]